MQTDFGGASGYIFPSEGQAAILNYKNSGELGQGKKFTKHGREKEILGKGEGEGKEMLAKPAVVTRTFFRHLNIVALKVCRVDNTCMICFCRKWILSSGTKLLHFHWLTIHFRKSDQAPLIGGLFKFNRLCGQAVLFFLHRQPPPPPLPPTFSHSRPILPVCSESKMTAKYSKDRKMKTTKTACTAGYSQLKELQAFSKLLPRQHVNIFTCRF